jgi:pSer/pThr/pTyr-binding forkhead associated (FHA) protein
MGRGAGTPDRPMFNLQPYKAHEFGVSRHHATIIVTPTQMYIVDEGSTNGTAVNGDLCMPNKKVPLNSKDVLSLSKMNFMVHVVRAPEVEERTG